jgi:branched-chain amino acid transport system ATP-binding protein
MTSLPQVGPGASQTSALAARNLSCGYGEVMVVRGVTLDVRPGEVVALLGPNGAGKTTTLLTLSGALTPRSGHVEWFGKPTTSPLHARAQSGLAFVTEERSVFMGLSARDNLRVGRVAPEAALTFFPELADRMKVRAGLLSGGEQQMLTLGRALARKPSVLLGDELSLGLAPLLVKRLLASVRAAADDGVAVLLVEQHVREVLKVADRVYVMRRGQIEIEGSAEEIGGRLGEIEMSYLSA